MWHQRLITTNYTNLQFHIETSDLLATIPAADFTEHSRAVSLQWRSSKTELPAQLVLFGLMPLSILAPDSDPWIQNMTGSMTA
jgi:hypothetical protein